MTATLIDCALKQLTTCVPALLYTVDIQLNYLYINQFFSQTHKVTPEKALGKSIASVIGQTAFDANFKYYQRALAGETVAYDSSFVKADGCLHYYTAIYEPLIVNKLQVGFTGVVIDKTAERELLRLSNTDALTRTCNRRKFEADIKTTLSNWQSGCFMILDLDHFKQVNDQLGHNEGDKVLINFSELLKRLVGPDGNVYRIGGEEFAVLCHSIKTIEALKLYAEKICKGISRLCLPTQRRITASIGATLITKDEQRHKLLKRTDDALYCAKTNGRNQVRYS